jgi:hypothetical protein
VQDHPIASYAAALRGDLKNAMMTSADIVASEKAGQQDLVNSSKLPKKGNWDLLKSWGLQIIDDADDLFYNVALPEGWTKQGTTHDMHSSLLDELGRKRAGIFYKAAFYDCRADITPIKARFCVSKHYGDDYSRDTIRFDVVDTALDSIVFKGSVGQYAFLDTDPKCLGFIVDGRFNFDTQDRYYETVFKKSVDATLATPLSVDDFYAKYHYVNPRHDVIEASENKAKEGAVSYLAGFLDGRGQWEI